MVIGSLLCFPMNMFYFSILLYVFGFGLVNRILFNSGPGHKQKQPSIRD